MTNSEIIAASGIVPVVVINDAKDALPTAEALLKGGIKVMEITFRTEAAAEAIKSVSENCPEMLVGAGTVVNLAQCKTAIEYGAKFIVSPGFKEDIVKYCIENDVMVIPGCVTPSEIMAAIDLGLTILKFFPANVYGGLSAMKALSAPFGKIKFIPTGGVNAENVGEYIAAPFIYAVGGSWICTAKDISEGNFAKITELSKKARETALGYEVAHVGINMPDADESMGVCEDFGKAFGFEIKPGNSSNFASSKIEVMKENYLGKNGHIAVRTNSIEMAIANLAEKGYYICKDTAKYKNDKMIAVYLEKEMGGFAIHLLQK